MAAWVDCPAVTQEPGGVPGLPPCAGARSVRCAPAALAPAPPKRLLHRPAHGRLQLLGHAGRRARGGVRPRQGLPLGGRPRLVPACRAPPSRRRAVAALLVLACLSQRVTYHQRRPCQRLLDLQSAAQTADTAFPRLASFTRPRRSGHLEQLSNACASDRRARTKVQQRGITVVLRVQREHLALYIAKSSRQTAPLGVFPFSHSLL